MISPQNNVSNEKFAADMQAAQNRASAINDAYYAGLNGQREFAGPSSVTPQLISSTGWDNGWTKVEGGKTNGTQFISDGYVYAPNTDARATVAEGYTLDSLGKASLKEGYTADAYGNATLSAGRANPGILDTSPASTTNEVTPPSNNTPVAPVAPVTPVVAALESVTPTAPASTGMTQDEYLQKLTDYQNQVAAQAAAAKQLALDQAWGSNQQALNSQNSTVANNYQSAVNALNLALQQQLPKYQAQKDSTSSEAAAAQRRTEALNAMGGTYNSGANRSQVLGIDLARQGALRGIEGDQNTFEASTQNKLSEADMSRVAALNDIAEKIALGTKQYNEGTLSLTNQLESDKAINASKSFLEAQAWADQQRQQEITNRFAEAQLTGNLNGQSTIAQQQLNQQATQFAATMAQNASQFTQTFGLSQQQLAEQIKQNGIDNVYRDSALAQAADQWAQQMGMSREQFAAQLSQWAQTFSYNANQDLIDNRFKWNEQDAYINTNPITGEDLTSKKTVGASSVTSLPSSIASQYPNATEITTNGNGGYTFTDSSGRRQYVSVD